MASFEAFHDRILDIVEDNPGSEEIISEEIAELDLKVQNSNRVHDMKKAASVVKISEEA
jgi:hypothetical protein